ncbi:MAG: MASE1 domain-containing protein [Rhodanobacter sp.]
MQSRAKAIRIAQFAGIALVYCISMILVRYLSLANWLILTGFHLTVLLLAPYRYWPALIAGDAARLAWISATCYAQFGLLWALVNLVPMICYLGPLVWLARERWRLAPERREVAVPALVLCALLASMIATLVIIGQIAITPKPSGYVVQYGGLLARLTLGNFLGALTVTPIALAAARAVRITPPGRWLSGLLDSRLVADGVLLLVPLLIFLVWAGNANAHARGAFQMAMFLPVTWMALRHGWIGAALGGACASLAIMALMPATADTVTLQAEALLAMAISTMLLLSARISAADERAVQDRQDLSRALALAQRNAYLGEAHLRTAATALDQIGQSVHAAFLLMLGRLRHLQPALDEASYNRHAFDAHDQLDRLSDGLYPTALRDRDLIEALSQGPTARTLNEAGACYHADTRGPVSLLQPVVRVTIYRIVAEAIALRCVTESYSDFHVRVRCFRGPQPWAVVRIDALRHPEHIHRLRWPMLRERLLRVTSGLGAVAIADRAATFEGYARERPIANGVRMSALLKNPAAEAAGSMLLTTNC